MGSLCQILLMGRKTTMSLPCPSADELSAFAVGNLPETAIARIADHVEVCQDCELRLQAFDSSSDGLVTSLKHLREPEEIENVAMPAELLPVIRKAVVASATGASTEISLD